MTDIEDRISIRELYDRYVWAIDDAATEAWVDCFTEDGIFDSPRFGRYQGVEGLRKFARVYTDSLGGAKTRHVTTNILFKIEGDRAEGKCLLTYFHTKHGRSELAGVGGYNDKLRKVNGRWLYEARRVFVDGRQ